MQIDQIFWFQICLESKYCAVSTSWFVSDLHGTCNCPSPPHNAGQLCDAPVDIEHALEPSCLEVGRSFFQISNFAREVNVRVVQGIFYFEKVNSSLRNLHTISFYASWI